MYLKTGGEAQERFHADIALAALDAADVIHVKARSFRQVFLAQARRQAEPPDFLAEHFQFLVDLHRENIRRGS